MPSYPYPLFPIFMSFLEQLASSRRNPFKNNLQFGSLPAESCLRQTNPFSCQSKPKRSLIRINPKKFPNDFFDIKQTLMCNKRPKPSKESSVETKACETPEKPTPMWKASVEWKNQQKFKETSFFKYAEEQEGRNAPRTSRGLVSRSETKRNDKRKKTADAPRERQTSNLMPSTQLSQSALFACTFSRNLSKQLSTEIQSPADGREDITNRLGESNRRYEKGYFRLGQLQTLPLRRPEAATTERMKHQLRLRHKANKDIQPFEHLPPITFR